MLERRHMDVKTLKRRRYNRRLDVMCRLGCKKYQSAYIPFSLTHKEKIIDRCQVIIYLIGFS